MARNVPLNTLRTPSSPSEVSHLHHRSLLRSCALGHVPPALGRSLHAALLKAGILLSPTYPNISNALFHMYAALGSSSSALRAFQDIPRPTLSSVDWTALISCYVRNAFPARALLLFRAMCREGLDPDEVTLLSVFSVAACLSYPIAGASAHIFLIKLGLPFTLSACNAAMNMYAKCGRMLEARRLFNETPCPNVVSWTVILVGSLRCEGISSGRKVFDLMPDRNDVSWTVMAASCVEAGLPREAFSLLADMIFPNASIIRRINHITLCSLISACSQAGDLIVGRWLHSTALKSGHFDDNHLLIVNTALIDMYAKCGRIEAAIALFEVMPATNVITWNAMLSGLSMHGMCAEALKLFSIMVKEEGLPPDDITFVSLLSALSRAGLVQRGRELFLEMKQVYGLTPKVEHYACMVDLLGRAGHLNEAETLIREMPVRPNEVVLGSLLASCSLHGKLKLGKKLSRELMEMNPNNTDYHVLLYNMCSSQGRHRDAEELRRQIKKSEQKKGPGLSYIEINGFVHRFCAGDKSHPRTLELYAKLDEIAQRLRFAGYYPNVASQVPRSMDNCLEGEEEREEREQALLAHSERLAVAFGLISSKPGMPLRIFKNLRICCDCHSAMKLISQIFSREIIVRDRNRFHRFKDGLCTCSDYCETGPYMWLVVIGMGSFVTSEYLLRPSG
ncbi:pentatricopeptide repeat-containing protein At5g15340, mitochondrial [Phalaenopsis equestris]|uniref:pentatricopeptide repeat-containing protein At5g15340, mitochondrial n=1 Tax=Phalaenopsis equestris TaxID=78828 RepID=UPI0009E496C7|nr:pentatricopeptide repeat-containing protein At5g15340, mitochondrial [Phalaenopsis equestris]